MTTRQPLGARGRAPDLTRMAVTATAHCLTGCARRGPRHGVGTAAHLSNTLSGQGHAVVRRRRDPHA